MAYTQTLGSIRYSFPDLKTLLAKSSPSRSGDRLAAIAAASERERVAAQFALADLPLTHLLDHHVLPYETDDVTRLIVDTAAKPSNLAAFAPIRHLTVGDFRNWLLTTTTTTESLAAVAPAITPEMASAVSRLMRNQDLIAVARKCRVVTRFRTTIGLPGRLAIRLQPNHPTDDPKGIAASMLDGLSYGCGDAVIGVNPARDNLATVTRLLRMLDDFRIAYDVPMQSCVLTHLTTTLAAMHAGAPVDLVFQSIGGTEDTNRSFGISLAMLREGYEAGMALNRGAQCADGTIGRNVMYFETGQGSSLSANAHHGVDQQTCEARAYAVARQYDPLLINSVVGFIGPEYLYNGKEIIRAGLEDHFCGKLLGLPMGCDVCYTNHADADQNDMDTLLTLLGVAGVNFVMGVPGADDIMLGYQSTSFHDALYLRQVLGLRHAPEFELWLERMGIADRNGLLLERKGSQLESYRRKLLGMATDRDPGRIDEDSRSIMDDSGGVHGLSPQNSWRQLKHFTHARIALGRNGNSLPTKPSLDFQMAHAAARDAIHYEMKVDLLSRQLTANGFKSISVHSKAPDRETYLQQPHLGRILSDESHKLLGQIASVPKTGDKDIVFVLADGLSPLAAERHSCAVLEQFGLIAPAWSVGPIVIASQARVAIGDPIGELLGARAVIVMIGERPGLSSPDSLGIYLTWDPRPGLSDANRNCISNIHGQGLSPEGAARQLASLLEGARALGKSGVDLHESAELEIPTRKRLQVDLAP